MSDVITEVDKYRKGWKGGLPETPCGSGSRLATTVKQREWIPQLIEKYGIRTVADIGAGDLNWISRMRWPAGVQYRAYDLVPRHRDVQPFDLVKQVPPQVDLLLCLWVLNHLPMEHSRAAIANLKASGSRLLLMTDRPRWYADQPAEIRMPYIEEMDLDTPAGDRLLLVAL